MKNAIRKIGTGLALMTGLGLAGFRLNQINENEIVRIEDEAIRSMRIAHVCPCLALDKADELNRTVNRYLRNHELTPEDVKNVKGYIDSLRNAVRQGRVGYSEYSLEQ